MKQKLIKTLATFCCAVLLLTAFGTMALAKEEYQWSLGSRENMFKVTLPTIPNHDWYALGNVVKVEQTAKYFVITTTAGPFTEQLYISFPAEGGFRLQSKHEYQETVEVSNVGLFEPESIATIEYRQDASGAVVMVGSDRTVLRFRQYTDGFVLDVLNAEGTRLVGISNEQISFAYSIAEEVVMTLVEFPLAEREGIYQGGERYNTTNQVGSYTSLANTNAWSAVDASYNNVPLFHSNRGYSVWFNMTYPGDADMGWSNEHKYALEFWGDKLDFYLWAGTPLENLKKYTDLTGTSGMYNEWTFGFWTGAANSCFKGTRTMNSYQNMVDLLEGYADNYNFYPEAMYGEGENSNYARNIQYQNERGIRSLTWYYPGSAESTMLTYLPGSTKYPVKNADGTYASYGYPYPYVTLLLEKLNLYQFQTNFWYDYSNPNSVEVIKSRLSQQWKWGVSGSMVDYGEEFTFRGTCFNGLPCLEMHNLYSYYYAKAVEEAWDEFWKGDYVLFERSGCAGSQYYVGNFLGDQNTSWVGFKSQVYAMISMGSSGFNLYGGDLGGLTGKMSNDLMSRWTVLSTFSPWMRQHGVNLHMPWEQGYANAKNFGTYYYFRKNIVPTVMSAAMDANKTSNPIVKGMMMAYPYQLKLVNVDNQYLFCDDFLVCVVGEEQQYNLDVVLPNGDTWYSLFTYEKYTGGQTITAQAPTAFMPVFVKDGAVKAIDLPESLTLGTEMHDPDDYGYDYAYEPHDSLLITPPDQERVSTIHVMDGNVTDFRTYNSHTEVYTSKPVSNSTFTVTNEEGSSRNTVLALGVTAAEITYDGQTLSRLDRMPDYINKEYGYYVERSGLTTIYLPTGWKELTVVKGAANYDAYKMTSDAKPATALFDGNHATTYQLPTISTRSTEFGLDYDEPQQIGRVVCRWAVGFYDDYNIEYTSDGVNWHLLTEYADDVCTVEDGAGSIDVIDIDPSAEIYALDLRLTMVERGDTRAQPAMYSFEVYPPDDFTPLAEDNSELPEYDEEDFEDLWGDEEDDSNTTIIRRKKYIVTTGLPVWAWILIIGSGVVVVSGIVLLILLLRRKKKKAVAALEEVSTDPLNEEGFNSLNEQE